MATLRVIRSVSVSAALVLTAGFVWLPPAVQAADNVAVSRAYQSDGAPIAPGALVSGKTGNTDAVELANIGSVSRLVGVVVTGSLVELSDGSDGVEVVTSGTAEVLVSDINGEVHSGDKITPSPISGVGMKATENTYIIGTAQGDMGSKPQDTRKVKDKTGSDRTVRIAQVPVQVGVSYFSSGTGSASLFVPPFLQAVANNIGGEPVSAIRVGAATLTMLLLFGIVFVVLRTTVSSSITAVGRNPLASDIVRRTVQEVGLTVTGLLIFGLLICYLILRL